MATEESDKKRTINYTEEELIELSTSVKARETILFGKFSTVGVSKSAKDRAWKEVKDAVNVVGGHNRTLDQIKTKYKNLKATTKKIASANKVEVHKTGGGSSKTLELTVAQEILLQTIPEETINGIPGGLDTSSTANHSKPEECAPSLVLVCGDQTSNTDTSKPKTQEKRTSESIAKECEKRKHRKVETPKVEVLMQNQIDAVLKQVTVFEEIRNEIKIRNGLEKEKLQEQKRMRSIQEEILTLMKSQANVSNE